MSVINREDALRICDNAINLWKGQHGEGALIAVRKSILSLPDADDGWIPVEDRLPEDDTEVLVYLFDRQSPYIAWLTDCHWYTEDFEVEKENEPLAWMPLPKPYEPKEDK